MAPRFLPLSVGVIFLSLPWTLAALISTSVNLPFNNVGTSNEPGGGNYSAGSSYVASLLPPPGLINIKGVNFSLPEYGTGLPDNLLASNQTVQLPNSRYLSLHVLAARETRIAGSNIILNYEDGSSLTTEVLVGPMWRWPYPPKGDIMSDYYFTASGIDHNSTHIHHWSVALNRFKNVTSITVPAPTSNRLHFFAVSLLSSDSNATAPAGHPTLELQSVKATQKWFDSGGTKEQVVQVSLINASPEDTLESWITHDHRVYLLSDCVETTSEAHILRLRPGDQSRVQVGISNVQGTAPGSNCSVEVVVQDTLTDEIIFTGQPIIIEAGLVTYTSDASSLTKHSAPDWYEDAKFGIFIHWGVYSVPAWAPINGTLNYAESYQWVQHVPNSTASPTWVHHKEVYGTDFTYEDFIPQWKADEWDPTRWLDLFVSAGAKYFVLTSKHHDGFTLFDAGETTNRTSVKLGPGRDLVAELFAAAHSEAYAEKIVPAIYYSMPEWLNPDYAKYGFGSWPGGQAHNAYNYSTIEPYTGHIPVNDYIDDLMTPQMESLLFDDRYGSAILWCDIGGPSHMPELAAKWYNWAAERGQQVVLNDRCSIKESDMATPELSKFSSIQERKWESCEGLDPHSFGYNANRPWNEYKNSTTILRNLIDITSKNGNYLLDVGPTANGTIIEPMAKPLLEVGQWLQLSGESLFGSTYWYLGGAQAGDNIRFTTKSDAFYIHSFVRPESQLVIPAPVPIVEGDSVTLLGGSGSNLPWMVDDSTGALTVMVDEEEINRVGIVWTFKVAYLL